GRGMAGRWLAGAARRHRRVRGAGHAGDPRRRPARLALGAALRPAPGPPAVDGLHRAAGLAGPAVSADGLGTGAAKPCRANHLRRILHPALAVAADLLRSAVVDVRRRLHRVRGAGGGVLVAVAASATLANDASGPVRRREITAVFLRLAIGAALRMPYISPAGTFGQKNS